MISFATIVLIVYALLMLVGGVMGYRVAGSRPSLFSGVISAILLLVALAWSQNSPRGGFVSAALIALLLSIVFAIRLARTHRFMPSGMLLIVSLIALVIFVAAALHTGGVLPAV